MGEKLKRISLVDVGNLLRKLANSEEHFHNASIELENNVWYEYVVKFKFDSDGGVVVDQELVMLTRKIEWAKQ